jgi:stalled ribosome rescue protein Dom34
MKIKTAIEALEDDYHVSFTITEDDIIEMSCRRYDELNAMTKEELIHMIMGDEPYYRAKGYIY